MASAAGLWSERRANVVVIAAFFMMMALLAITEPSPSSDPWPDLFATPASPEIADLHDRARDLCGCEEFGIGEARTTRRVVAGSATSL